MGKFDKLAEMVTKGKLETVRVIDGIAIGYRTLTSEEEASVARNVYDNPAAGKMEQLALAITSIDGVSISNDPKEREELRKYLGQLHFNHIHTLYVPYLELLGEIPELTKENIEAPLGNTQQSEAYTKLS